MRTLTMCCAVFLGCSGAVTVSNRADAGQITCDSDDQCPPGQICRGGICGTYGRANDDSEVGEPRIIVSPVELDFGAPLFDVSVIQELTVFNVSRASLAISRIAVEENDTLDEFSANPSGETGWTLEPLGELEIHVELRFEDIEEDHGHLVIQSNDPESSVLRVPLISELKGDPEVAACVLRKGWMDRFSDCEADREVRFSVMFEESASARITIWNRGADNRPLEVRSIALVDEMPGLTMDVRFATGAVAEFPTYLSAPQSADEDPEYITVQLDFTGVENTYMGGVLDELTDVIRIISNWEDRPEYDLPVRARVECPEGCDGRVCDACCIPTGPEICDGDDNDCNGEVDEDPLAELCTTPPEPECDGFTHRIFEDLGICNAGECRYTIVETECVAPEHGITECRPWGCWVACEEGYEPCEEGCCWRGIWSALPPVSDVSDLERTGIWDFSMIWTGEEMIVWGGYWGLGSGMSNRGLAYNMAADEWNELPRVEAPSPRFGHTAIWTGDVMIIWGGGSPDGSNDSTGGIYDASADRWSSLINEDDTGRRYLHSAVWTGSEMIIWSGTDGYRPINGGWRYNLADNRWRSMGRENEPASRSISHTTIWTGSEMVVWGGGWDVFLADGARYDPEIDEWTPLPVEDAPRSRGYHTAVWTGDEMIIWGGTSEWGPAIPLSDGGRYVPEEDVWIDMREPDIEARYFHSAVWTGEEMIVWGGQERNGDRYLNSGGRYNPREDQWVPTASVNALSARSRHAAVWTGEEMLIWGGFTSDSNPHVGARYRP